MKEEGTFPEENRSPRQEYLRREQEQLLRHAQAINSSIIPETPGYVRTTGPRRQYRAEVIDGVLHIIEI